MDYTLEYNGEVKTFEAWGLEGLKLQWSAFEAGVATFTSAGQAYDSAALFAPDAAGIIRLGSAVVLSGFFGEADRRGEGNAEVVSYVLRDAWHDLESRFYVGPTWTFPALTSTVGAMYAAVVNAAAAAGVAIQFGGAANLGAGTPALEFRDQTFAEMLRALRRIVPDVQHFFDYSTSPPTIYFVRRADATALTLTPDGEWDGIRIRALHDLQSAGVVLYYAKQVDNGSGPAETRYADVYPPGTTPGGRRVVVATFDLRGNQVQTQALTTSNINALSKAWWGQKFPWVNDATGSNFTITNTSRRIQNGSGQWVDDTTGSVNEIVEGGVPGWLSQAQTVLVTARANNFILNGQSYSSVPLQVTIHATSLAGGLYVDETDPGEEPPAGLAQAYYEATSVLHHEGSISRAVGELSTPLVHCGMVLNLGGTAAAARGWNTMRAVIRSVEIDVDAAKVAISFGPPAHLGLQDMLAMSRLRGQQGREVVTRGSAGGGVRRTAANNSVPQPAAGTPERAWQLRLDGSVVPGTIQPASGGAQIPRIAGQPISGGASVPTLNIPNNGFLVAELSFNLTWNDNWLSGAVLTSISLATLSAVPANNLADGKFYRSLGTINGGVPSAPTVDRANLTWSLCANAANAATLTLA